MISPELLAGIGVVVGSTIGSAIVASRTAKKTVIGAKNGAAEGAAATLNGTKEAVQRIESGLVRHMLDTGNRFDRIEGRQDVEESRHAEHRRRNDDHIVALQRAIAHVGDGVKRKATKAVADKARRTPAKKKPRAR